MQYKVDYQYLASGADRPEDYGEVVGIEASDTSVGVVVLPNVGDFVRVERRSPETAFGGRVATRSFSYTEAGGEWFCVVNIVIEEAPGQDWEKLLKQ